MLHTPAADAQRANQTLNPRARLLLTRPVSTGSGQRALGTQDDLTARGERRRILAEDGAPAQHRGHHASDERQVLIR